jgi:hypothetical protein
MSEKKEAYIVLVSEFTDFSGKEVRLEYRFRQPSVSDLSRSSQEAQKSPIRAFRNLLLSCAHPDEEASLREHLDQYPGVATTFVNEIYECMGFGSLGK